MHPSQIGWQQKQWQQFCQQKEQNRLPHAILLSGHKGLGKVDFAKYIVASVLCQSPVNSEACGKCHSCHLLAANSHPDHQEIKPEAVGKQIKVDDIRALKDKQQLTAIVSKWKTVLIAPADAMNISSSNSLLKLLEEPQDNTLLILVSDKVDSLPITIRSRCQYIHLNSPPEAEGLSYFQQKGVDANDEDKKTALDLAKGAPMLAVSFFENEGLAQYRQLKQDFNQVLRAKANPITLAESWQEYDLLDILKQLQYQLKKQLLSRENHQSNATYWQVYDCLLSTIKLTSTRNNLNNKLLAEEFLVTIMKICQQNK